MSASYGTSDYKTLKKLCSAFGTTVAKVRSQKKGRTSEKRNAIQWVLRHIAGWTWQRIANIFNKLDHSTAIKNVKNFEGWIAVRSDLREWFEDILRKIVIFFRKD